VPEIVGDSVDRLCAVEFRYAPAEDGKLPRGVKTPLFEAARRAAGRPMTYLAAKGLVDNVGSGDRVFVVCGSGSPPYLPFGETDGPLGGASIARALDLGLGAKPIVISEAHMMGPNRATFVAAGLAIHDEEVFEVRPHSALAIEFPYGMNTRTMVEELFDIHKPTAIVFVERTGPNTAGVYHSVRGTAKREEDIIAGHLFAEIAAERGVFSIGIGDGGNEIGFGNIHAEAQDIQPAGRKCLCPCGEGVITVAKTDVLVSASISNWGAYGVSAMLGFLLRKPELVQEPEMEFEMLRACAAAGASDGSHISPIMYVDGTSWRVQLALVTMLREMISNAMTPLGRPF
jgi:D-glutamate cyclase